MAVTIRGSASVLSTTEPATEQSHWPAGLGVVSKKIFAEIFFSIFFQNLRLTIVVSSNFASIFRGKKSRIRF
jgi:hypothetical protein